VSAKPTKPTHAQLGAAQTAAAGAEAAANRACHWARDAAAAHAAGMHALADDCVSRAKTAATTAKLHAETARQLNASDAYTKAAQNSAARALAWATVAEAHAMGKSITLPGGADEIAAMGYVDAAAKAALSAATAAVTAAKCAIDVNAEMYVACGAEARAAVATKVAAIAVHTFRASKAATAAAKACAEASNAAVDAFAGDPGGVDRAVKACRLAKRRAVTATRCADDAEAALDGFPGVTEPKSPGQRPTTVKS
jgi:trimeric autotransporter adhesin